MENKGLSQCQPFIILPLKTNMYITSKEAEKAVLVGVALQSRGVTNEQMREYLDELSFLAETAGAETVKIFTQNLEKPVHATFIGRGKLEEIHAKYRSLAMAQAVTTQEADVAAARSRFDKLVREIDKCISLLNE